MTNAILWYDNRSESADFKERVGGSGRTGEQCVVPEDQDRGSG